VNVWNSVSDSRFKVYGHQGVLHFHRDGDGVVQEKYFRTFEDFQKEYASSKIEGLMVDLSDKKN
jgi:hypothetical protein